MGAVQGRVAVSDAGIGCDCQGACCKRINLETREVEQCSHLTEENLCDIYEERPIACRIAEYNSPVMTALHCRLCRASIATGTPVPELLERLQSCTIDKVTPSGSQSTGT